MKTKQYTPPRDEDATMTEKEWIEYVLNDPNAHPKIRLHAEALEEIAIATAEKEDDNPLSVDDIKQRIDSIVDWIAE